MSVHNNNTDRGWAMMSTGAGLLMLLLVTVWAAPLISDWMAKRAWMTTAAQASRFTQAVKSYTGRYYDTLLAGASATVPVTITPAMLKNTGFLEPGFSETTAEGQAWLAAVVRNSTNTEQLQGLVYTRGGAALPFLALRQIAMDISSGMGGYVWQADAATGAMGGWSVPLATFGAATSQGHIASLLTADDLGAARGENDRLYRFAVTGRPDLNTMHTSIDMGANDLNNTGTVNAETGAFSGNVTAGGDIRSTGGWLITQDDKGWINETHGGGFYMSDNDWVRVVNNKGVQTDGPLQGGTVRADGRLSTGEVLQLDGINVAGAACASNGLVSRDASGAILSCQSGVWLAPVGKPKFTQYSYTSYEESFHYYGIGQHDFCTSQYGNENNRDDSWRGVQKLSDGSWRIVVKDGSETAMCLDW